VAGTLLSTGFAAGVDLKVVSATMGRAMAAFTADVYVTVLGEMAESAASAIAAFVPRKGKITPFVPAMSQQEPKMITENRSAATPDRRNGWSTAEARGFDSRIGGNPNRISRFVSRPTVRPGCLILRRLVEWWLRAPSEGRKSTISTGHKLEALITGSAL
jgi:hypothetical protein